MCELCAVLTLWVLVRVVLERVSADEVDVVEEVLRRLVAVQVDLTHHCRQVHRLRDDLVVIRDLRDARYMSAPPRDPFSLHSVRRLVQTVDVKCEQNQTCSVKSPPSEVLTSVLHTGIALLLPCEDNVMRRT